MSTVTDNVWCYYCAVVKRAIIDGMDHDVTGCEAVSALLCYLYYQDIITQSQLLQGLNRVHDVSTVVSMLYHCRGMMKGV